jgi:hypothetical protein
VEAHLDPLHVHGVRIVVVEHALVCELAVGEDQVVVVARAQVGGAPGDRDHAPLLLAHPDPVVDAERLLDADHQAGEEVAEDGLERQTEHQGGDGAGRDQRRDVQLRKAEPQGDEAGEEIDEGHRHRRQERRQAQAPAGGQVDVEQVEPEEAQHRDQAEEQQHPAEHPGHRHRPEGGLEQGEGPDGGRDRAHVEREGHLADEEEAPLQGGNQDDEERQRPGAAEDGEGHGHEADSILRGLR